VRVGTSVCSVITETDGLKRTEGLHLCSFPLGFLSCRVGCSDPFSLGRWKGETREFLGIVPG
jgi:hypothetical protein